MELSWEYSLPHSLKSTTSTGVFIAAIISEIAVIALYNLSDIGFLWYNIVGCNLLVAFLH